MHKQGYVQWVGGNKYKGRQLYSFTIKGTDGFFSCGTTDPQVIKNDHIEFDYNENNGGFSVDVTSIRKVKLDDGVVEGRTARPISGPPAQGGSREGYWEGKAERDLENDKYKRENDVRIQFQSARNAAIAWIGHLLSQGAVKLPEKNKKEVLDGLLVDYTDKFFNETSTVPPLETEIPFGDETANEGATSGN